MSEISYKKFPPPTQKYLCISFHEGYTCKTFCCKTLKVFWTENVLVDVKAFLITQRSFPRPGNHPFDTPLSKYVRNINFHLLSYFLKAKALCCFIKESYFLFFPSSSFRTPPGIWCEKGKFITKVIWIATTSGFMVS